MLFQVIEDIPKNLAKSNPTFVVKIARILENEQHLDRSLEQKDKTKILHHENQSQDSDPFSSSESGLKYKCF